MSEKIKEAITKWVIIIIVIISLFFLFTRTNFGTEAGFAFTRFVRYVNNFLTGLHQNTNVVKGRAEALKIK